MINVIKRTKIIRLILLIIISVALVFFIIQTFSESEEDNMEDDLEFFDQEVSYQVINLDLLGILEKTKEGYELDRKSTRAEAASILRLLGVEIAIEESNTNEKISYQEYMALLLRALGYMEGEDFTWETLQEKSIAIHLITNKEYSYLKEHDFLRRDLVNLSYRALFIKQKNTEKTLIEKLEEEGKLKNNKWRDIGKGTIKEVLKYDEVQYGAYFNELEDISLKDKIYNKPSEEIPKSNIEKPLVLIHCSHQHEKFIDGEGILVAAQKLYEYLNDLGIPTIIDIRKVERVMDENPTLLGEYYIAARSLIIQQKELNESLKYKIDLHVDQHDGMHTIEYNGRQYAILMPVIGNGSANKEEVEQFANRVASMLQEEIPTLAKEPYLYVRRPGVGGNFGQDLFEKPILIEVGTGNTELRAAENSMEILAKAIKNIIEEDKDL